MQAGIIVLMKLRILPALLIFTTVSLSSCRNELGGSLTNGRYGASIESLTTEQLPSSNTHAPNSTWWGYNMSKIVRHGSNVYYGIIQDDSGLRNTNANFNIYKKPDGAEPVLVASLITSRPGNVLVDHLGRLHAIIFEAHSVSVNDSIGSLVHYQYDDVESDDFTLSSRIVVNEAVNPYQEVVNIRLGATTNNLGHLAVAHGLYSDPISGTRAKYLYTKSPTGAWVTNKLTGLDHEFYYPFVVYDDYGKASLLPVQDDYVAGNPPFNRYYIVPFMTFEAGTWNSVRLADYSQHPLAISDQRPQLTEQSELFETTTGELVAIYKDKRSNRHTFRVRTISTSGAVSSESTLDWAIGMNWLRAFEIEGELYYLALSWESAFIAKASSGVVKKVNLPGLKKGVYPYTSAGRGGASRNALTTIDFLMISGASSSYPSPGTQLYQMPKESIKSLF
jgi:hypothetical protein